MVLLSVPDEASRDDPDDPDELGEDAGPKPVVGAALAPPRREPDLRAGLLRYDGLPHHLAAWSVRLALRPRRREQETVVGTAGVVHRGLVLSPHGGRPRSGSTLLSAARECLPDHGAMSAATCRLSTQEHCQTPTYRRHSECPWNHPLVSMHLTTAAALQAAEAATGASPPPFALAVCGDGVPMSKLTTERNVVTCPYCLAEQIADAEPTGAKDSAPITTWRAVADAVGTSVATLRSS